MSYEYHLAIAWKCCVEIVSANGASGLNGKTATQQKWKLLTIINVKQHRKSPLAPLFQSGELKPTLKKGVEQSGGGFGCILLGWHIFHAR
jgi:hypothetical protein